MKRFLALALIALLSTVAHAGRGFAGSDLIVANGIGTPLDISSGPLTVSAWFYPTTVDSSEHDIVTHWQGNQTGSQFIISLGGSISGGGNTVQWEVGCCGAETGVYGNCGTIVANQWYHVLLSVDANGKYSGSPAAGLGVTGFSCGGQAFREKRAAGGANLNIGGFNGTPNFKGYIAEVGIWNDVLTSQEQAALAAGVSPNKIRRSTLVGYYPLYGANAVGTSVNNPNLDDTKTGWQWNPPCIGPSCAGGTGTATSTNYTINNGTPSLDGESGEFTLTCTSCGLTSGQTTNVLWPWKAGANDMYTSFIGAYNIYIPSITNIQALEFDQFQFNSGQRFMMGSECDKGGNWRIWNQLTASWVSTSTACTIFTATTWHSIVWATHRVSGDTSCAGSNPCMYYDSLTVDGVTARGFTPQPSAPSGDPENNGIQFQIDQDFTGGTSSVYMDEMSLVLETGNPVAIEPDYSGNSDNGTLIGTTTAPHCPCGFPLGN